MLACRTEMITMRNVVLKVRRCRSTNARGLKGARVKCVGGLVSMTTEVEESGYSGIYALAL